MHPYSHDCVDRDEINSLFENYYTFNSYVYSTNGKKIIRNSLFLIKSSIILEENQHLRYPKSNFFTNQKFRFLEKKVIAIPLAEENGMPKSTPTIEIMSIIEFNKYCETLYDEMCDYLYVRDLEAVNSLELYISKQLNTLEDEYKSNKLKHLFDNVIQNSTFGLSRPKYYDITNGKFSIYNSDNRYLFESCKLKDRLLFQKSIGEYQDFKEANSEISKVSIFIQLIIKYKLFRY